MNDDRPVCLTCGGGHYMISNDSGRWHKKGCPGDKHNAKVRQSLPRTFPMPDGGPY